MAKKSKNDPLAVDAYLATLSRAERESLEALESSSRTRFRTRRSVCHPLPTGLVKKILRARVRENAQTDTGRPH